jgi:hypothetical protein
MPHLNPLITLSTEMGHREPMTINAFASSFLFEVLLKAVRITYVVRVRYLEKTQVSLRPALIAFAYCINLDEHS